MSLQAILDAICASGEDEIREIEARAQTRVEEILAQAQSDGARLREQARTGAAAPAVGERARILHQARLKALQIVGDAREGLVDTVLSRSKVYLAGMRSQAAYADTLRWLIEEAVAELGPLEEAGRARLLADGRDQELLEGLLRELRLEMPISYELRGWGGLILESEDGRVVVMNGLEARFERALPYLRRYLCALVDEVAEEVSCPAMTMAMPVCGR